MAATASKTDTSTKRHWSRKDFLSLTCLSFLVLQGIAPCVQYESWTPASSANPCVNILFHLSLDHYKSETIRIAEEWIIKVKQ